jgi:hypothetical protein
LSHRHHVLARSPFRSRLGLTTLCLGLLGAGGASAQSTPPPDKSWCEHVAGGPSGALTGPFALSAAHARVRFFGTGNTNTEADLALAPALEGSTVDWDAAAVAYAAAMEPACAVDTTPMSLPPARVLSLGPITYVRPGTGDLRLPRQTRAVVIDLRGLPAAPGLEAALAKAIGAASTTPVERVSRRVRIHEGMTDELRYNVYWNDVEVQALPPYAATGSAELPVALLTGRTLAPEAARFAVDLRMARRAWLVGEAVTTAVAESQWMPIGKKGLAVRTEQLEDAQGVVPDILPADLSFSADLGNEAQVATGVARLSFSGRPAPVDRTLPIQRPALLGRDPLFEPFPPLAASQGIARADLLILHGAVQLFFPYFHVVGNGTDARLLETLAAVDAQPVTDRVQVMRLLERFSEVLKDGHAFNSAPGRPAPGFFAVSLEQVAGEPVIRRSATPGVNPGDTLISVGGRPMAEWLAEVKARTSAATPGYLMELAMTQLLELSGPTVFGLRAPDGTTRTVEVQPKTYAEMFAVDGAPSRRPSGSLADLGAPTLHYINLDGDFLGGTAGFLQALRGASGATGLVLDMRGYPGGNHYLYAQHLIPHSFTSPLFRVPYRPGADRFDTVERWYDEQPLSDPSYAGPIVLLVGPESVSAAENFSIMLTAAGRVTVIGRQSAGTNGNITGLALPGGMMTQFTGMEVQFPDRTRFHGVGIVPHIVSEPTIADLAAGRDTELLRAIQFLGTGQ